MMRIKERYEKALAWFEANMPVAESELHFENEYQLLVAVMLSAQCTDKRVNLVTPALFEAYPTIADLADSNAETVLKYIRSVSYPNSKAEHLVQMAKRVVDVYRGNIPDSREELQTLAGVGRKTANVVLTEGFKIPRIPVDTHVERVSKRLGIIDDKATVLDVENKLMLLIEESKWHKAHHLLLFMGRYKCLAKNPKCSDCFYNENCKYDKKTS